jgi:hypothetical protein
MHFSRRLRSPQLCFRATSSMRSCKSGSPKARHPKNVIGTATADVSTWALPAPDQTRGPHRHERAAVPTSRQAIRDSTQSPVACRPPVEL